MLPQIKPGPLKLQMAGRRILVHHFIAWCTKPDIEQADIIISGHTHEVSNQRQDGRLFLNPGECCGWVGERPTVAVLDTDQITACQSGSRYRQEGCSPRIESGKVTNSGRRTAFFWTFAAGRGVRFSMASPSR